MICAYSPEGEPLWSVCTEPSEAYYNPTVGGLMITPADDIYALTIPALSSTDTLPLVLTKVSKEGELLWTKSMDTGYSQVIINSSSMNAQGNITAAGYVVDTSWNMRPYVAKADAEGELKYFTVCMADADKSMIFNSAYTDAQGYTYAAGKTETYSASEDAPVYVKLTPEGTVEFEQYQPETNGFFNNVGPTDDGIILSGTKYDLNGDLGWIRKVDTDLQTVWDKSYGDFSTYMTNMSPANALDFAGYTTDANGVTRLFVAQFGADGELLNNYVGEAVSNSKSNLELVPLAVADGRLMAAANVQEATNIFASLLNCYTMPGESGLKAIADDALWSRRGSVITVEGASAVNLYSASGALIAAFPASRIDVAAVPAGIYILRAQTPAGEKTAKLMLTK